MSMRQLYEEHVDGLMSDHDWFKLITDVKDELNNGPVDRVWVDTLVQKWAGRGKYDNYDAYGFIQLHAMCCAGVLTFHTLDIGSEPAPDSEIEENNKRLKQGLAGSCFDATFYGGTQPGDGNLSINKALPVEFMKRHAKGNWETVKIEDHFPHGCITLEVGYTEIHTTYFTLMEQLYLARWPYGQSDITVLVLDRKWWNTRRPKWQLPDVKQLSSEEPRQLPLFAALA